LNVYDTTGKKIAEFTNISSTQQLIWRTETIPNGIYYYRLTYDNSLSQIGKVVVTK